MAPYADLHAHTTVSDGQLTLADVPLAATEAGVAVVALTDHDRIHPELDDTITERDGITIIRSIELRVKPSQLNERIDLLGYAVEPTEKLLAESDRLQADRIERANTIIARVEEQLGITLDIDVGRGIGRPHIARAIDAHPESGYSYTEAFEELIGHDCPCYKARNYTSFEDGLELLREACRLVGLAHPYRYDDPERAVALTRHLDAVEYYYPYADDPEMEFLDHVVDDYDLVVTGGSDVHDYTFGKAGLSKAEYQAFRDALQDE